ncbi:uncharacterized protein isoform X3 [Rhodnius prolixus]|uniref:uncharacterized protein isoform X3 n=1 Tax=Rhodnius prolixus TaxID=13249 RepID=UPI003D18C063
MSVSDPLIKELKGFATKFLNESPKPITDEDKNVRSFCECIEKIFYKGLNIQRNVIGFFRAPECWSWLEHIGDEKLGCPYSYVSCIEKIKRSDKVTTNFGKVRLLIRIALVRRCIHVPVQILTFSEGCKSMYSTSSILGDEILSQVLLSVLMIVSKLEFKLDVENAMFLDTTWHLPKAVQLQLVPCNTLGISIMFVSGKALVTNVLQDSVAAENGNVMVGDILDTLNGVVINDSLQGSLVNIMRKGAGQPVSLYVIKGVSRGELYAPLLPLLRQAGIEPKFVVEQNMRDTRINSLTSDTGSKITFVGTIETGERNEVKQIFIAINVLLNTGKSENLDVFIECHDLGIKVINTKTQQVVFEHAYMEISSCGCTTATPFYFAYIAGERMLKKSDIEQIFIGIETFDNQKYYNNGCYINYLLTPF